MFLTVLTFFFSFFFFFFDIQNCYVVLTLLMVCLQVHKAGTEHIMWSKNCRDLLQEYTMCCQVDT